MTIDERLEALTHSLELLQLEHAEQAKKMEQEQREAEKRRKQDARRFYQLVQSIVVAGLQALQDGSEEEGDGHGN
jgi:multidrug resistance efflux pump